MLDVAKDVKEGNAEYWDLEYCNPQGRRTTSDDPNAIASDDCKFVAEVLREARKIKKLSEFM